MAQSTAQGIAYNQLKPTEGGNIGAIVEENLRYWQKYKDEKEYKEQAKKAQMREHERKLAEDQGKRFDKANALLGLEDSNGYQRFQIVGAYDNLKPVLTALAMDYANTSNQESYLKLQNYKEKFKELTTLDKTIEGIVKEQLIGGESNPNFNQYLDQDILTNLDNINNKLFKVTEDLDIILPDPRDQNKTIKMSASEAGNYWRNAKYSGDPKFEATGKAISEAIKLKDNNGNLVLGSGNRAQGITRWKNHLMNTPLALNTAVAQFKDVVGEIGAEGITPTQMSTLSAKMFDDYSESAIQEKDNSLANANSRLDAQGKKQRLAEGETTINLREDGRGNRATEIEWGGKTIQLDPNTRIFGLEGNELKSFVDPKGRTVVPTNIQLRKNGEVRIMGKAVEETLVDARNENGDIIYETNSDGIIKKVKNPVTGEREPVSKKTIVRKEIEDVIVGDQVTVGNVITKVTNPLTNEKFKSTTEASRAFEEIAPTIKPNTQQQQQSTNNGANPYGI